MEAKNEPNFESHRNDIPDKMPKKDQTSHLEPRPEKNQEEKEESVFMKTIKKVGFSVWITVMVIGGGLAFIVALMLL